MTYGTGDKILIQTPLMPAPFGISSFTDEGSGKVSYNLNLAFKGMDQDPKMQAFHSALKEIDVATIDYLTANSEKIFGEETPRSIVQYNYTPIAKAGQKDKKNPDIVYPPSMQIKLPPPTDPTAVPNVEIFDENKQKVEDEHKRADLSYVANHSLVKAIFELRAVWFVGRLV